jgi:transcriptional regulator with XRE-family HTH domain
MREYSNTKPVSQLSLNDKNIVMLYFCRMEKNRSDVAIFIAEARKSLNMTQEVFGEALGGYTKGNISQWEKGKYEPPYNVLREISKMSGIPLPHDDAAKLLRSMGIDYKKISINQMELALKSLQVPDNQSIDAKKILDVFIKPDGKTETN